MLTVLSVTLSYYFVCSGHKLNVTVVPEAITLFCPTMFSIAVEIILLSTTNLHTFAIFDY